MGTTRSTNEIRTAIRELSARAELARKEGRPDDAAELEGARRPATATNSPRGPEAERRLGLG